MSFRITYATLSTDNDELHAAYDRGIADARALLGARYSSIVDGKAVDGAETWEERSPIDRNIVVGSFGAASTDDVAAAIGAARGYAKTWAATPWETRCEMLDRAADLISERRNVLSAILAFEVGKNRLEALGDVEETADLIRYYTHAMREHDGFAVPMQRLSPNEATYDVLRPFGVWAIISPFNFPAALSGGPMGAALAAGNTVVLKPSEAGFLTSLKMAEAFWDGGVPAGALHVLLGPGETVGRALVTDSRVDGITFTGSYDVGMQIFNDFRGAFPKPVICEMGGKNPVVVSRHADLDVAATGTMRSAFGLSGQKCSAASRAYIERDVYDEFVATLAAKTEALVVGNPLERDVYMGPVIDRAAVGRYESALADARAHGRVIVGGHVLAEGEFARGNYVAPTVVEVSDESRLWRDELFVPLVAVRPVDSLDEAFALANDTPLGLTAGFYSREAAEIDAFLATVDAGVVYINRAAGATTGAWPGVQPFGGWKGSGAAGKAAGGPYYLQQYLREQSRTIVEL